MNNKELLTEIIKCKASNQISHRLGEMIFELVERKSRTANYYNYDKDDMVACACERLCHCILLFDPLKSSNPFAYCMTVITSSFHGFIARNKKHHNINNPHESEVKFEDSLYNEDRFFPHQLEVDISLNMEHFLDWVNRCKGTWKIVEVVSDGKYKLMFTHKEDLMFAKVTFG